MAETVRATNLKLGAVILIKNQYFSVVERNRSKVARGGTTVRAKLKNLSTGANIPKTWGGDETVELADYTSTKAQYLYSDEKNHYFMEKDTFEQYEYPIEKDKKLAKYLTPDLEVFLNKTGSSIISITLPPKVKLKVVESPPNESGNTADGASNKQIVLETGLTVNAPMFIKEGDFVLVNTEEEKYVERAK